jgi:hypothetical protein
LLQDAAELRMKANATEDGAVGWVSVRDASGKKLLIDCM